MKIHFCCTNPLTHELGAAKLLLELKEELEPLGWTCSFSVPSDMGQPDEGEKSLDYAQALRHYLHQHAAEYDVVEYDHGHLPYPRSEFPSNTLMVARSILLSHHFLSINIPRSFKEHLSYWRRGTTVRRESKANCDRAHRTLQQADLIALSNEDDKKELLRSGIPEDKMMVIPYGLSRTHQALFNVIPSDPPLDFKVAFVGTFDSRKGARDFPTIVRSIRAAEPRATFRLLGTGPGRTANYVRPFFHAADREHLEIIPEFPPEDLPRWLADCSIGIFPSYIESFGFGVLEMLAASLPVVAYNSPGPTTLLPFDYLVPPGDAAGMARKVVGLLQNKAELTQARGWAKEHSRDFSFAETARRTSEAYLKHLEKKRRKPRES